MTREQEIISRLESKKEAKWLNSALKSQLKQFALKQCRYCKHTYFYQNGFIKCYDDYCEHCGNILDDDKNDTIFESNDYYAIKDLCG